MKTFITAWRLAVVSALLIGLSAVGSYSADTDQRALATEYAVGANHATLSDTINRLNLAFHDNAGRHLFKGGSTVASAATIAVPDDSNYFLVSGTTTISAISAKSAGEIIVIKFDSAIRLTHNATSLVCPNARDLALEAGSVVTLHEYSSGNWRVVSVAGEDYASDENILHNGDFSVAQRGAGPFTSATTPANSDDTYLLDRWVLLSDGNDIVDVSQSASSPPTGHLYSIALDTETANKKFGILQIIEAKDAVKIIGGKASLSFDAKVTSAAAGRIDNVKAVVLSWSSTSDTVTSDVVSAWGAEDTTPTWAANWTAENTPANLGVTTSWATYKIENISIDTASTTNVAVFIWCDAFSGTPADFLNIAKVKLNPGPIATPYINRPYQQELMLCQRYLPGITGASANMLGSGMIYSTSGGVYDALIFWPFSVPPRAAITGATLNGVSIATVQATTALSCRQSASSLTACAGLTYSRGGLVGLELDVVGGANTGFTVGHATTCQFNATATILGTGAEL